MVRAVGAVLCFQADAVMLLIPDAALARHAVQKVAGIELHRRLGGENGKPPAAFGVGKLRCGVQGIAAFGVVAQQEIVVIAPGIFQLRPVRRDALPDGVGGGEIQRRPGNRQHLPGGQQLAVGWGKVIGRQLQPVVQDIPFPLPRQIKIGVVGQVQQGVALLRRGGIVDDQGVILRQAVAHLHVQPAGVALLPRLRGVGKNHHIIDVLGAPLPQLPVKAPFAAVQVVSAVIGTKGIGFPI